VTYRLLKCGEIDEVQVGIILDRDLLDEIEILVTTVTSADIRCGSKEVDIRHYKLESVQCLRK
jgi:hypothetical protein